MTLACAPPPPVPDTPEPALAITVGTSGDYAPFSTRQDDERRGFDIEIALEMARSLRRPVEWVPFAWPELGARVKENAFHVVMSGITWQPERAVVGYMTRAVASGGPCLLGDPQAQAIGVNKGGALEAWARQALGDRELLLVDDNLSLPALLTSGRVGAIVTDNFELTSFRREGWDSHCEAPIWRKVYWVAPKESERLGPWLDDWLRDHEAFVRQASERWLGAPSALGPKAHLVDLLARRMAFMPFVAAYKRAHRLPIEDPAQEVRVLEAAVSEASDVGLEGPALEALFRRLMELAKAIQMRSTSEHSLDLKRSLDLNREVRPALLGLGKRIVVALRDARDSGTLATLTLSDLGPLAPWLTGAELESLQERLAVLSSFE
jgi:cyclohexadienyl dehydratase